jgi:hypothetical protein
MNKDISIRSKSHNGSHIDDMTAIEDALTAKSGERLR